MKLGDLVREAVNNRIGIVIRPDVVYPIDVELYNDFCKVMLSNGEIITLHKDFLIILSNNC